MELIKYHKKYNRGEIDIMLSSTNDTIILHTDNIDRISGKKELIKLDEIEKDLINRKYIFLKAEAKLSEA